MTQPRIVLRASAGPTVGLGHLQRSLGLAVAFRERGCFCVVRAQEAGDVRARVESLELQFDAATGPWSAAEEILALDRLEPAAAIVDSYEALEQDVSALRREGRPLVVIDDLAAFPMGCDIVVNGAAGAEELPYDLLAPGARLLLGTEYVLLHPQLWDVTPRPPAEQVQNVLVTGGGSADSAEQLQKLLAAVEKASATFDVTVATPEGVLAALESSLQPSDRRAKLVSPESTVGEAAGTADLAVASAGGSTRELLRLGVPTIAVVTAENQRHGARGLARLGAVELFESVDEAEVGLARTLDKLIGSYPDRLRLAEHGPQIVDGQGCRRVAAAVLELLG